MPYVLATRKYFSFLEFGRGDVKRGMACYNFGSLKEGRGSLLEKGA